MEKTEQLHIRLSTQEKERVHKLAELKGISVSELIRDWINRVYTSKVGEPSDN